MRYFVAMTVIALMCVFAPISGAVAQDKLEPADLSAPKEKTVKKTDMSDIPDDYIVEASKFGEKCRNDDEMPLYFDCRCMAVDYLDKRKELGPEADPVAVQNQLGANCKDGTGIAGKMYEDCLQDFANAPKHLDPEEFCGCYSNKFAKLYEQVEKILTTRVKMAILKRARLTCQDPATARKLYGTL